MTPGARPQNPFPGLRPFRPEESGRFFGRDDQIGEALDRLMRQKLLAVVGMSGCGKSSLVTAGMVPALEMGLAGDPKQQWRVEIMRPGDGPLRELERCLGLGGVPLAQRTYGLREAVKAHLPADHNLLLVVDQFEEIFPFRDRLREGGGSEADLFVSYLLSAAEDPAARTYIVLTMRSDYLGECAKFHGLPEALNDGQYLVPRMTREQLQEAIENPLAAVVGADGKPVQFHQGLVQKLLNDCDEEPENLPLLQHLLHRLFEEWEQQGARGQITPDMARDVGGLSDALNRDAKEVFDKLSSGQQRIAEVMFRRITESRRQAGGRTGDRPVRSPQTIAHLAALTEAPDADLRAVVRCFEQRGLLVVRRTDESDKVDLPHECLCLKWRTLKGWIEQEAQDAKALRFLADSVGKSHLTGSALTEAVAWQDAGRLKGSWAERYLSREQVPQVDDWVRESQLLVMEEQGRAIRDAERIAEEQKIAAVAEKRAADRTKIFLAAMIVVALIASGTAVWGFREATRAEEEATRAEEARSIAQLALQHIEENWNKQLNGQDAGLTLSALGMMSEVDSVEDAVGQISDENVTSNFWVAQFAAALDEVSAPETADWKQKVRTALAARLSQARDLQHPPPAADDESLNARVLIPAGGFKMAVGTTAHDVTVPAFWIQEHEVTNEEYRRFDPEHDEAADAKLPVVDVSWYDAAAYAAWLGGSLPTEEQWEFAARGAGDKGRTYPWGEAKPTCDRANFGACRPNKLKPAKAGRDGGRTPEGVYDLAGNVDEWCNSQSFPALRGGNFTEKASSLQGDAQSEAPPEYSEFTTGFRVVWSSLGKPD